MDDNHLCMQDIQHCERIFNCAKRETETRGLTWKKAVGDMQNRRLLIESWILASTTSLLSSGSPSAFGMERRRNGASAGATFDTPW